MAEETDTTEEETHDYSWVPEAHLKDGKPDTEGFRKSYDELVAFKAAKDDEAAKAAEGKPESADELQVRLPEDFKLPEDIVLPEGMELKLDENDPDLPVLRQLAFDQGWGQEGLDRLLSLYAVREARAAMARQEDAQQEMAKLGPEGKTRIDTVKRALEARLSANEAKALADGITSADALRGLERLFFKGKPSTQTPGGKPDMRNLTVDERLELAAEMRRAKRAS